jgi:hypothetical protein
MRDLPIAQTDSELPMLASTRDLLTKAEEKLMPHAAVPCASGWAA